MRKPFANSLRSIEEAAEVSAPCPLCAGPSDHFACAEDVEYFTSDRTIDYRHCRACGILFADPMLSDRLAQIYPANYYSFAPTRRSFAETVKTMLDRRFLRRLTQKIAGPELRVLDVGGGTGWLLDQIRICDPRITATEVVDIDEKAGAIARAKGHSYFLGPFETFETNQRFDLILMLNLVEHVARPDLMLEKARSLLAPGGRIVIKTPNFDALDARLFRHRSWGGYHAPRHFILFTKESFTKLASGSGLSIATFAYTQGAPFWSISTLNELRRLGLVKGSKDRPLIYHPVMPLFQAAFAAFDFARRPFGRLSQMLFVLQHQALQQP
jgi:2-polyprenyl-3-methyl-5-hydroxy-6-metoxy-1,4-benzoquinol methylase